MNTLPPYVFLPTGLFLAKLISHKEGENRSKWVTDFAVQLVEGVGSDDFAKSLLETALIKQNASMLRMRRSRAKAELVNEGIKNPTRQQIEERLKEIYAEEEITAAASTSDGEDVVPDRESGSFARTTGCNNSSPDASSGNAEGVITNGSPITRNGSRASCTSATSGRTIEALEQPRAREVSPESVFASSPALPAPTKTDPKPTRKAKAEVKPEEQKYPHGEFENIMLTTREYAQLCERLDNADSLIEEADGYFEAQPDKKRKYKSHYAMLLNWDRRRKEFEGVKPKKFKTAVDQDREEIKWLSDYYAKKERGENPPLPKIKMVGSA